MNTKRFLYALPFMGLFTLLFMLSHAPMTGETTAFFFSKWLPSQPFKEQLARLSFTAWGDVISVETRGYYGMLQFIFRKIVHFTFFGVLAISALGCFPPSRFRFFYAALLTIGVAFFDEWHQSWVPGRTGSFVDVLIDSAGALTFLVFTFGCVKLIQRPCTHSKKHNIR